MRCTRALQLRRVLWSGGLLALLTLGTTASLRGGGPPTRHVLFLNSYHHGFDWSDDLVRGTRAALDAQPYPVELWVEDMDTRRVSGAEQERRLEDLLRSKYAGRTFDAIVAADDAALAFLVKRHEAFFPGVPVVFLGINSEALIASADTRTYTGVREIFLTNDIVSLATTLRPETRRIVVVGDATPTAAVQLDEYRGIAAKRPDLEFVYLDGARLPLELILEQLRSTTARDAVMTTAFTRDYTGRYFPRDEALEQIAAAAQAPVYSAAVSELGQGLLAGSENAGPGHATRAAGMLIRVLEGTSPADIPRESDDRPRYVIDYAQAMRWGIPASSLPPTAIVVNRVVSFYETYRSLLWGTLAFIVLQALVIGALVVNVVQRRRAERELAGRARELAISNAELERANLSLRREMDERRQAEDQLRQAQRIEAIGRLAGGVAHDFNNLLTVIAGYTDILSETTGHSDEMAAHVEQIRRATERATTLTQQLLAFSRKQVLQPRVVDLNEVVRGLEPMLRRLIGEDIDLLVQLDAQPLAVVVDPGQMEQVIMNLATNARDAMPRGGQVLMETRHVTLDAEHIGDRPGMTPGVYVQLAVTDSGDGMTDETRARVFEPFFTTKGPGEGTGLGLSTAYGIVKQSGGWIWVYSEAQGTTFKIYLPSTSAPIAAAPPAPAAKRRPVATETVLLVEDQVDVRALAARILRRDGYVVIDAASGAEAIARAAAHHGPIDVLLTDVVMPGVSGREVAERLAAARPGLRVLFMSGYTDNVIAQRGVLDPGTAFLAKPFTADQLATKVREVLEA